MMNRVLLWVGLLAATSACGAKGDSADGGAALSATEQGIVDELLAASSDYRSWPQTPDWTGIQASAGSAHGDWVQIWWSADAFASYEAGGSTPLPEGAILVKEGYEDEAGASVLAVTYLYKKDGTFYAATDASGSVNDAGYDTTYCIDCHEGAPDGVLSVTW